MLGTYFKKGRYGIYVILGREMEGCFIFLNFMLKLRKFIQELVAFEEK
jgi:hypothetical protein